METNTQEETTLARKSFEGLEPFKDLKNGSHKRLTKSLFYEMFNDTQISMRKFIPPFTLYTDIKGLVNFRKEYVALQDQTGYKMAQKYLGGDYGHWELLMKQKWFKDEKAKWDRELEAKIHSEAIEAIQGIAKGDGATALQAARFLAQKGFKMAQKDTQRGRPSNEEMEGHIKNQLEAEKQVLDDLERIRSVK